ncbi:ribosome biogenesis protein tsr1 [Blastocladiella emersonii ATCC 22665]|nr:ribosome biogenesis protein tsr1 [Blastocladiella emersonii ATCC 22665]
MSHSHRSTLKQSNKPFKAGHASKRTLKNKAKGKVERPSEAPRASVRKTTLNSEEAKANRRNAAKIAMKNKRADHMAAERMYTGRSGAPKVVAIVPLCTDADVHGALASLFASVGETYVPSAAPAATLQTKFKQQRITFLKPARALDAVLDAVKVADYTMLLLSAKVEVDAFGQEVLLPAIQQQGIPTPMAMIQHLHAAASSAKDQAAIRMSLLSYTTYWTADPDRTLALDVPAECTKAVRFITDRLPKSITWRDQYPYMIPDHVAARPAADAPAGVTDVVDVAITGHVRGNRLSANRLVHIPGVGDFQIAQVLSASTHAAADAMDTANEVLDEPDSDADDLVSENEPDDLMNEQTWPTEAEIALAAGRGIKRTKRVPKGTSSYQASWIIDEDDGSDAEEIGGGGAEGEDAGFTSHPHASANVDWSHVTGFSGSFNPASHGQPDRHTGGDGDVDMSTDSGSAGGEAADGDLGDDDEEYEDVEIDDRASVWDTKMDAAEQARQLEAYLEQQRRERAEQAEEDLDYPDEVETPLTVPAKVRFARYRGLKSVRKSPWDPYENLPRDYARLFQFENWMRTRHRVTKEHAEFATVAPGNYVTIVLRNVPSHVANVFFLPGVTDPADVVKGTASGALFWVVGLLPYEHKVTTLQFSVQRRDEYTEPMRSKDEVIVQAGWRRFRAAPVWSEMGRDGGNKVFKFERFLQPKRVAMGTVFAPNTYYGPVLLLAPGTESQLPAVMATGNVVGADANRIIAKRVVLTGHPYKMHKKVAVIRWMFYSPDDVHWFKPVQLYTRNGRTGHIRESLGTHGYMKCIFDGPVQQNETVCMNLYKRIFPKTFASLIAPAVPGAAAYAEVWTAPPTIAGADDEDEMMMDE